MAKLQQLEQQNQYLTSQLQFNRAPVTQQQSYQPPVPEVVVPDKDKFWENPGESTKSLVENLLARQFAPLQQSLGSFLQRQQFDNAKTTMKRMPQFAQLAAVEDLFDNTISQAIQSGIPLTDGLLQTAYYSAVGIGMQTGRFNQVQNNPTPQFQQQQQYQPGSFTPGQNVPVPQQQYNASPPPQNNLVTPPYLQSSQNQQLNNGVNVRLRQLDENEEIVRKHNGMSQAAFLFWGNEIDFNTFKAADPIAAAKLEKQGGQR